MSEAPDSIHTAAPVSVMERPSSVAPMTMERAEGLRMDGNGPGTPLSVKTAENPVMQTQPDPEPENPTVEDSQFEGKFTPEPPLPLPEPIEKGMDDAIGYDS